MLIKKFITAFAIMSLLATSTAFADIKPCNEVLDVVDIPEANNFTILDNNRVVKAEYLTLENLPSIPESVNVETVSSWEDEGVIVTKKLKRPENLPRHKKSTKSKNLNPVKEGDEVIETDSKAPVIEETTEATEVSEDLEVATSSIIPEENILNLGKGKSLGSFKLTGYCSCAECQGGWGTWTATGTHVTENRTIAVDKHVIPLGTWVDINIPGEGWKRYLAEDVGGGVSGNHIDVYVGDIHSNTFLPAYNGYAEVRLVEEA